MFERTKNLQLSVIKQMELAASKYPDVVSLAQGIPSFDTPECIKKRVENALKRGVVAKYSLSPGLPELRELVELSLEKEKMYYDWETEIIITAGTIEGITSSILAITNPGDEIIVPTPTYTSYKEVIKLAGCEPIFVSLNEKKGWEFELDLYEKAVTNKTKAIFYCNPNNPTGTIYSKDQLLGLARIAEKHDLFLISDEVYKDFLYTQTDKNNFFSLAQVPELRQRTIRLYGFSKAYAMTGWRVGYVHSDQSIIKEILKVHDSLVTCAPVISQYAAMGALEMGERDLTLHNKEYFQRLNLICKRLDSLKHIFSYVKPNSSYYIFPKINEAILNAIPDKYEQKGNSWKFCSYLLEKVQVAFVPGIAFGPNGENHVRISFGRSQKDINKTFDRLDKFFK